ncbi:hypothetical protein K490DRAFT_71661 [Saccharata proteae CBS 121410]|uniref:Uncharacterized protein n=1 Tax=Saccharata proteae CBS 121410 TaxID=1314787 RepID=A0A9P4I0G9_9PEZI|nr:hypothetical protein K490DRAFT_71661 [Saccharata proteae CBS 121410]
MYDELAVCLLGEHRPSSCFALSLIITVSSAREYWSWGSLAQRQQQARVFYQADPYSRPSSSSGSLPQSPPSSIRRTPNFDDRRRRPRSASIDVAQEAKDADQTSGRARSLSHGPNRAPHPALRISRRTASAIQFTLEEALRTPNPFTPDLVEENASMSDLVGGAGSGRAANGGSRAGGPIPVQQHPGPIRTPQQILKARHDREAKKQTEAQAAAKAREEQQRIQQEERRKSAERRAAAAGVAGQSGNTGYGRDTAGPHDAGTATMATRPSERIPSGVGGPVNAPASSRASDTQFGMRSRGPSLSQGQPRPAPTQPASAHSRQPSGSVPVARQPSGAGHAPQARTANTGAGDGSSRDPTVSSFPHAFERWEQLSSHWEGLTSYWIRRLEQNTEEMGDTSLTQQMSRQITDLSAAGANLFHAVVELQRLRASSERKFQRWFYETRSEQERSQEVQGQMSKGIEIERQARTEAEDNLRGAEQAKRNAEKMVAEMRRELTISKDEARRAWEELGRREQEERDRTMSLRDGQPTLVGGVQVVPMQGMASTHGSISHRTATSSSQGQHAGGLSDPTPVEGEYTYGEEAMSPTDTDPFTESRIHHEPDVQSLAQGTYQPMPPSSNGGTSTVQSGMRPPQPIAPLQPSSRTTGAPLTGPISTTSEPPPSHFYQHEGTFLPGGREPQARTYETGDDRSYVPSEMESSSVGEEEWMIDEHGEYVHDISGRRVPYRRGLLSEGSDELDIQDQLAHERELVQRYGVPASHAETTSAGEHSQRNATAPADYSGSGYGDWATVQRHHHPTRLSDVLEEDERSRTSPSRASQTSRGMY